MLRFLIFASPPTLGGITRAQDIYRGGYAFNLFRQSQRGKWLTLFSLPHISSYDSVPVASVDTSNRYACAREPWTFGVVQAVYTWIVSEQERGSA